MNPDGPHVWLKLPDWWGSADFVAYARRRGLALVPSTVFTISGERRSGPGLHWAAHRMLQALRNPCMACCRSCNTNAHPALPILCDLRAVSGIDGTI